MMKNDVIELVITSTEVDDVGDTIQSITYKKIFAEKKSIGTSEFYQAHSEGLKPTYKFVIDPLEYTTDITHIKYEEDIYKIIRTYEKNITDLEITVEKDIH